MEKNVKVERIVKRAILLCTNDSKDNLRLSDFVLDYCYDACMQLKIEPERYVFYNGIHVYLEKNPNIARLEERTGIHYIYLSKESIKEAKGGCKTCD